jgi:hypothetical protein
MPARKVLHKLHARRTKQKFINLKIYIMNKFNSLITDEEVQEYFLFLLKKSNCERDIEIKDNRIYIDHYSDPHLHELQLQTELEAHFGDDLSEGSYMEVMAMRYDWYKKAYKVREFFDNIWGCECRQGFVSEDEFRDFYEISTKDAKRFVFESFLILIIVYLLKIHFLLVFQI